MPDGGGGKGDRCFVSSPSVAAGAPSRWRGRWRGLTFTRELPISRPLRYAASLSPGFSRSQSRPTRCTTPAKAGAQLGSVAN